MDDLNFYCQKHKSPIGGICSEIFCSKNPMMCILCAVDEESCIKQSNHELTTFEEFFLKYENQLKSKFPGRNLTLLGFLNILNNLNPEAVQNEFTDKMKERNETVQSFFNDYKTKILDTMNIKFAEVKNKMKEPVASLKQAKLLTEKMNANGFDIVGETDLFDDKLTGFSTRHPEFKIERLYPPKEKEINKKHDNRDGVQNLQSSYEDYKFLQKLVQQIKFLQEDNRGGEIKTKLMTVKTIIQFFENKQKDTETNTDDFKMILNSLENNVPDINKITLSSLSLYTKNKSNSNYNLLQKFLSKNIKDEIFSYSNKDLFNTSQKQPYCSLEPTNLKLLYNLVKDFQRKKGLMDMISLFKLKNGLEFLAYSSDNNKVNIVSLDNISDNMNVVSLKKINLGFMNKIEHYQNEEGKDYLVTVSNYKTVNKFEYCYNESKFVHKQTLKLTGITYAIEIVMIENIYCLFVAEYYSNIRQYDLNQLSLMKNFNNCISNYVYCMKAIYHKYLKTDFLIVTTITSIEIYDIKTGTLYRTITSLVIAHFLSLTLIEIPLEKDYYIVANIQSNVAVFSFNNGNQIRKMSPQENLSFQGGIEIWNEKFVCVGSESGKIIFFNLNTGEFVCSLTGHTKSVAGVKRYHSKTLGDVLFSFSIDGTIKLWSY